MAWTSSEQFEARKKAEINAINTLRSAFFIGFMSALFGVVVVLLIEFSTITSLVINAETEYENPIAWLITLSVIQGVSAFFTMVYLHALDRARKFIVHFASDFGIVKTGAILVAGGVIVNLITTIIATATGTSFVFNFTTLGISVAGALVIFIGNVLIAIGVFKLGEHYGDSELKLFAILMIFLGVIGILLVYSALGNVIKKIEKRVPPPPVPPWLLRMEKHL